MILREYQEQISDRAVNIIKEHGLCYLSMQTRTGKTATALMVAEKLGKISVLFVTKKKAQKSILSDYFSMNLLFVVDVISVDSCHKYGSLRYDFVIIDEAHCIGAYPKPSIRAKNLKKIVGKTDCLFLSATPTPESFSQIYHQFWVSEKSPFAYYPTFYKWAKDFVNIKQKLRSGYYVNDYSDAKKNNINDLTKHLFISYTQEEAGFENTIQEKILYCRTNDLVDMYIRKIAKDGILKLSDDCVIVADTAVKKQSKIHQLSSGTIIDENKNVLIIDKSKAYFLRNYFEGKKIAIFYKYIGEKNVLKEVFANSYTESPEDFQEGKKSVFVGQFISAREGIRLDTADAIVFYNIDFSYLSYEQAKNRIVSKERNQSAVLYWLFSESKYTIEKKIYEVVTKKKDFTSYYFKKNYKELL